MTFSTVGNSLENQRAQKSEIATLAVKFYLDRNCEDGHDRENWLCAEYMLAEKLLIQYKLNSLHNRLRA